jgi:general secretion pathway protein M
MTQQLAWLSRLAAVALLFAVLGGGYFLGVSPLIAAYRQNTDSLKEAEDLLARFQVVAAAEDGLQEELREIGERHALQRYYLAKETDALAAAEIQDWIKAAVQEHGGTIRSIQTLPGDDEGELRRVILRMQMTTTTAALFRIAHALETNQPLLFIDNVDIQSRSTRQTGQQHTEPVLTVSLDVYGYRSPEVP